MSYSSSGKMPIERASKIGHMKFIEDAYLQNLVKAFEAVDSGSTPLIGYLSGKIDLNIAHTIKHVIAIDGGQAIVPNVIAKRKSAAYISVCAIALELEFIRSLKKAPVVDPRDLARQLQSCIRVDRAILPLSGINLPGETIRDTIRNVIHRTLIEHKLYDTLQFLLVRPYDHSYQLGGTGAPHFRCINCRSVLYIPQGAPTSFKCTKCNCSHYLSDWLGITEDAPEDWAREEAASNLRNVMEALRLFHYVRRIDEVDSSLFSEFLFLKDGPLGLWSKTSGLVDPIKAYISWLRDSGRLLNLVGIEKSGELVNQSSDISSHLPEPGMFFLPNQRYLVEEIAGRTYDPASRNTVQYGVKSVVRVGKNHVLSLSIPTGEFLHDPSPADLIGFENSVRAVSELLSYQYENALLPIVLANQFSSISEKPSGDILERFLKTNIT